MNHNAMLPVGMFYQNESVNSSDMEKILNQINQFKNYPTNYIRVFSTLLKFELTMDDVKSIINSDAKRYDDEKFENYKIRMSTKNGFSRYAVKILNMLKKDINLGTVEMKEPENV